MEDENVILHSAYNIQHHKRTKKLEMWHVSNTFTIKPSVVFHQLWDVIFMYCEYQMFATS
mgnify:CR=1 FL=1